MKETQTYKLNQWEKADRIVMADFNSDNAKLDAALAALSGRVDAAGDNSALASKLGRTEVLMEDTSSDAINWMSVSDYVDSWNDWDMYGILFVPDLSQCSGDDGVYLELMGPKASDTRIRTDLSLGPFLALLFPWHSEDRIVQGVILGPGPTVLRADLPFKKISKIGIGLKTSQSHLFSGTHLTLFGLR